VIGQFTRSIPIMGTIVTIGIVRDAGTHDAVGYASAQEPVAAAVDRACEWFHEIERLCNRFDPKSELRRLSAGTGEPVAVSETLYTLIEFALAVAEETDGAFDPTIGREMEARGFNRDYRSGEVTGTPGGADRRVSFRDLHLDRDRRTVTLGRPLMLDLGAVAKGLAIDLGVQELQPFRNFVIDAGGDLYLGGRNPVGEPWTVGIRHPRLDREVMGTITVSDRAVCTSGDYERPGHIVDPRPDRAGDAVVSLSATVVAPTAMLADALATAAFVLGPREGIDLLDRHGVDGLILSPALERFTTRGLARAFLPNP
jgi:FAD:protein FMN transferase